MASEFNPAFFKTYFEPIQQGKTGQREKKGILLCANKEFCILATPVP